MATQTAQTAITRRSFELELFALRQLENVNGRPVESLPIYPLLSGLRQIEDYIDLDALLQKLNQDDLRDCRRHLCRTDLYYLLRYELRRPDIERQWLLERCQEVQANPNGHLDLWARHHYKSTISTFGLTIQDILSGHGENPDEKWNGIEPTFCIFSHTKGIARAFAFQLMMELETNDHLIDLFPDVLFSDPRSQSPRWSLDNGFVVRRKSNPKEATVESWGLVDGQPTSKHFYVRIYDDVVTQESVSTAAMIEKTTRAWELSLSLGVDGGIERYLGTRYDENDTYDTFLKRDVATPRIYPATKNGQVDGELVLMSEQAWADLVKKNSPYTLSCQYLQNPTPDENAFFRQIDGETVKYYDPKNPPQHTKNYGVTDGAVTKDGGDYTVHIVFGVTAGWDIVIWDLWRKQEETDVWVDVQCHWAKQFGTIKWFGEGGVIEKAVGPMRRRRMAELRKFFTYETIPSITDKESRAASVQGFWNNGRVYLPRGAKWIPDFLLELKRFPNSTVDDQADAFGMIGRVCDTLAAGSRPAEEKPLNRDYSGRPKPKDASTQESHGTEDYAKRLGLSRVPSGDWRDNLGLRRKR